MRSEWVGRVDFDPAIAMKVKTKHNLTPEQVRQAVMFGRGVGTFRDDTPYGPRLRVVGWSDDGVQIKAFLAPVDRTDGHWECMTAVRVP